MYILWSQRSFSNSFKNCLISHNRYHHKCVKIRDRIKNEVHCKIRFPIFSTSHSCLSSFIYQFLSPLVAYSIYLNTFYRTMVFGQIYRQNIRPNAMVNKLILIRSTTAPQVNRKKYCGYNGCPKI